MAKYNRHFDALEPNYLYARIAEERAKAEALNPSLQILDMGIGDVSLPIVPAVLTAICDAAFSMNKEPIGYGPSVGYSFLRRVIAESEYAGWDIAPEEVFVSDGINRDCYGINELFAPDQRFLIPAPAYPVYFSSQVLQGRGHQVTFLPCTEEQAFHPVPPEDLHADVVFLCSPANPTGEALTRAELKAWIDWAIEHRAVILFDGAYADYVVSQNVPRSIFEIPGAKQVAIEFRSLSKGAGFTGLRLGFTVIPHELQIEGKSLNALWTLRQNIQCNGVAYPIQKAGVKALTGDGRVQTRMQVASYLNKAHDLRKQLIESGQTVYGGMDSPYLWWKAPMDDWEFFQYLLKEQKIVCIPGSGYGEEGKGFVRLSSFLNGRQFQLAQERLSKLYAFTS